VSHFLVSFFRGQANSSNYEAHPNIYIYEDAEGSLGILSQFISAVDVFKRVIEEAYRLYRYDDPDYLDEASYDDLLSYYNQRHHKVIDRFEIKDALEKLKLCRQMCRKKLSEYWQLYPSNRVLHVEA